MTQLFLEIITIVLVCITTDFLTYKFIRKLDKKERQKLQKWETDYLNKMLEKEKKSTIE